MFGRRATAHQGERQLGISGDLADEEEEWRKVDVALELGAEAIMDLSNSGKTRAFRRALIERSSAMVGTVPMYDAIGYLEKALIDITPDDFLEMSIRAHAEDGVDFVTVHAGMNPSESSNRSRKQGASRTSSAGVAR